MQPQLSDDEIVANQWWNMAKRLAADRALSFDPGCERDLKRLFARSVMRLSSDQTMNVEKSHRVAEENLSALIEEMIAVATSNGSEVLHEWSLQQALAKLCPIFPFC